jgi:hypothetical protein
VAVVVGAVVGGAVVGAVEGLVVGAVVAPPFGLHVVVPVSEKVPPDSVWNSQL